MILILDFSGSMLDYGRDQLAIEAATTVLETLTIHDFFAVVRFDSDATVLGQSQSAPELMRATSANM